MELSPDEVDFIVNHLFLPPKLPQADDRNPRLENTLLRVVADSAINFARLVPQRQQPAVLLITTAINRLIASRDESGSVSPERLLQAMQNLTSAPKGSVIPLHIGEQNAAVFLSKTDNGIVFEAFELSPHNEAVMSTAGRLRRYFPGPAVVITTEIFDDTEFRSTLAKTLSKMSVQKGTGMTPTVRKSHNNVQETRDTTHPGLVTELLLSMLGAFSAAIDIQRICKNTRDEVLWQDSLLPWRRSPLWLLVRVLAQSQFTRFHGSTSTEDQGIRMYKLFILHILATVLDSCLQLEGKVESEKLDFMIAKLAGRILKLDLDETDDEPGISFAKQVLGKAKTRLEQHWAGIRETLSRHLSLDILKDLEFTNDTKLYLPELDAFVARIPSRKPATDGLDFVPTPGLFEFPATNLPDPSFGNATESKMHNLHAFEEWVSCHLPNWAEEHVSSAQTCQSIKILMQKYHLEANCLYSGNPEASSIMMLTLVELWIICDKSAVASFPLLADYNPGIPQGHLRYLLLPLREQMTRLAKVEHYLDARRERARYGTPGSIFTDFGTAASFGARFYDQSSKHQVMCQAIEKDATLERQHKREELAKKKRKYNEHMRLYEQLSCDYVKRKDRWGDLYDQHSQCCIRHQHLSDAKKIKIHVHEWPLPQDTHQLKSVVFELDPPAAFCEWRNATVYLVLDVLGSVYASGARPTYDYKLATCLLLRRYYKGSNHRICLLSEAKPHTVTHRNKNFPIPSTTLNDLCLNNGLQFHYFDTNTAMQCFTSKVKPSEAVLKQCTFDLPSASSTLHRFIYRRFDEQDPLPNDVIATQSKCPVHFSLAEYRALASLPIGHRIGWNNILVQLKSPLIDFKRPEASFFVFQTMYQAGPMEAYSIHRASHSVLANEDFTQSLLRAIREAAGRVEENWESLHALGLMISITRRQLSLLIPSSALVLEALQVLSDLRSIASRWMSLIILKHQDARNDTQRAEFRDKIVEAALVCCGTFDVDDEYLENILFGNDGPAQASMLIHCGILIHDDYSFKNQKASGSLVPLLHGRWQRLSFRAYPLLSKLILEKEGQSCLNEAIRVHWPAYKAGDAWVLARSDIDYWVTSNTTSRSVGGMKMHLHYNLLTGRLLVNGLPLSRLPIEYEQHDTYSELFGGTVFKIIPSSTPAMRFCAQGLYRGHSVQFGLEMPNLIVQATEENCVFEVLPRGLFRSRLPDTFVDHYVHWYDAASDKVIFRDRSDPWKSSRSTWTLSRDNTGWKLDKDGTRLISSTSLTGRTVTSIFAPIQAPLHINMVLDRTRRRLEIELPRLQLEFYLERRTTSVVSRKHRGLEVDSNQSIGALVGLRTKLVLIDPSSNDRKVIVPTGSVSVSRDSGHVSVTITSNPTSPYVYKVDQFLQRLTDNGSLESKLFLCYLHALTSFCLPDPLTCRTGTEQALSILKSAAVQSFPLLTAEHLSLLQHIDSLTPRRAYYPAHEKVMQTVKWDHNLPSLSQHPHFHTAVEDLFAHYQLTQLFHPNDYIRPPSIDGISQFLSYRDASRTSRFRISCFGAEDLITTSDRVYSARDKGQSTNRARQAQIIATMLFRRDEILYRQPPYHPNLAGYILRKLKSVGHVNGPSSLSPSLPLLEYDSQWLEGEHQKYWADLWCWFHQETRTQSQTSVTGKFQMMMWFATMAFSDEADLDLLHAAAAMVLIPEIKAIKPVERPHFSLENGDKAVLTTLLGAVSKAELPFERSPEYNMHLPIIEGETQRARWEKRQSLYQDKKDMALSQFVDHVFPQFPTCTPTQPVGDVQAFIRKYVDIAKAMIAIEPLFATWYDNRLFTLYIQDFGKIMGRQTYQTLEAPIPVFEPPAFCPCQQYHAITSADFFAGIPGESDSVLPRHEFERLVSRHRAVVAQPHLEALVQRLEFRPGSKYEQEYAKELRKSSNKLISGLDRQQYVLGMVKNQLRLVLQEYLSSAEQHMSRLFDTIVNSIRTSLGKRLFAESLFQSPRLSSMFLLQQLSMHGWAVGGGWTALPSCWKTSIVEYGKAVAQVQRTKRLLKYLSKGQENDLIRELKSEGHTNWSPSQYPEALLLEIENDITIREVQADIAEQMMNPPHSGNAVMQLNMGEGKSSVIVPMVSSALADGSKLVRVVVAKPQSRQMFHMLMVALGGMINRRIFHLPFSRAVRLSTVEAGSIAKQCNLCRETGGIMLVQPEQILSFKLMGLETLINGQEGISRSLIQTQHMFETCSRDIVDESDENFSVKFELIYPLGSQRSIDFAPMRWTMIQSVLNILRSYAREVLNNLPDSIELVEGLTGSFPRVRFLKADASTLMLSKVVEYICTKGLPGFSIFHQCLRVRRAVFRYITHPKLSTDEVVEVEGSAFWSDETKNYILLLRGLFAKGILAFVYGQKRWRVNYGLDKSRNPPTALAVPYRAKDSPTPRSEYSHPDVVIVLTCNSYYYQGLSDEELFLAFGHLIESDQADAEYNDWLRDSHRLPPGFRQLVGVNLKDTFQCKEQLFPCFRYGKRTIDYFLQYIVFPKHMKEFPKKLTASGWDLGAVKTHPTTGFSGTIDSRQVLPLDVSYLDLAEQKHTNAQVLEYLLRPENRVILLPPVRREDHDNASSQTSDAEALLREVLAQHDRKLRVILDVGAQILELNNAEVAQTWLQMAHEQDPSVQAAIYVDDNEDLMVLDLKGVGDYLQISPYIDQLDACLVFLDEAHTRGTDLKLPADYKAAVTLGPRLTKDRLVQACMRMRKLGHGQSIVFCVPTEVQHKIIELETHRTSARSHSTDTTPEIGVLEVLSWCIGETIIDLQRSIPLWAVQGKRFDRQDAFWKESITDGGIEMTSSQAHRFLEDEAQSLEHRYRPHPRESNGSLQVQSSERLRSIQHRCSEVGAPQFEETALQEEQERELAPEVEEERQIEKPAPQGPEQHFIHPHLTTFVSSGKLPAVSSAVMPAFKSLHDTSAADYIDVNTFPKDILVTMDFARTVKKSTAGRFLSDAYQRPVQWILSSQPTGWDTVIIISPFEANELLPNICKSRHVTLHLYSARPNQEFRPLDRLDLFSVPSLPTDWSSPFPLELRVHLNLFAGQLYLESSAEYEELCRMLRLSHEVASEGTEVGGDGFIHSSTSEVILRIIRASSFTKSPVKFLNTFLSKTRRDCQSIEKTHVGKILGGALLQAKDFDEKDEEGDKMDTSE